MAIVAEEQITPDAPRPTPTTKRTTSVWTRTSQLRQATPMLRFLAEVWAIPQVMRIGMLIDSPAIHVWVLTDTDDAEAEARIVSAERDYLAATPDHQFELDVLPIDAISLEMLPAFESILKR